MKSANQRARKTNKRLRSKYGWIKSEFEYVEDCCQEGDTEMRASDLWRRMLEEEGIYSGGQAQGEGEGGDAGVISADVLCGEDIFKTPDDLDTDEDHPIAGAKPKDPNAKKLFRKLIEKTHPDKTKSNDNVEDFFKAREAYENNNLAELVALCMKYNIDIPEYLVEAENASLEGSIKEMEENIASKKRTLAYAWYNAESDEQKQTLLNMVKAQFLNQG